MRKFLSQVWPPFATACPIFFPFLFSFILLKLTVSQNLCFVTCAGGLDTICFWCFDIEPHFIWHILQPGWVILFIFFCFLLCVI